MFIEFIQFLNYICKYYFKRKMNIEDIRLYCLGKPYTEECLPFDEFSLVIKVLGRMFIFIPLENPETITLKCDPDYALSLRDSYEGIFPAWHFNKKYWNQVKIISDVPSHLIKELIDHSYCEVVKKLKKADQEKVNSISSSSK